MSGGVTTIPIIDGQGTPQTALAGSNVAGQLSIGHTLFDINGSPLGSETNPLFVVPPGMSLNHNRVTVTTGGNLIVPARGNRSSVLILQTGNIAIALGNSGVTLTNGIPLPGVPYATFSFDGGAAIYGIASTGSQDVIFLETY